MSSRYLIKIRCHAPNIAIKDKIVFVRWVEGKFFRVLKDVKFPNVLKFVDIYIYAFLVYTCTCNLVKHYTVEQHETIDKRSLEYLFNYS